MNCIHDHDILVLYYYGELTEAEQEAVRAQLTQCDACRSAWRDIESDMMALDRLVERTDVKAADMQSIREAARDVIRSAAARVPAANVPAANVPAAHRAPSRPPRRQFLRWAASVAAAFLVFVTGWYFGAVENEATWARAVQFDSHRQQVRIAYGGDPETYLSGSVHDAPMQRELGYILASDIDPVNRMRAARALASARIAPNVEVSGVLSNVLAHDDNPVVRLQAVRALQHLYDARPLPESLRQILIERVEADANTAVRMKAMELLVMSEQVSTGTTLALEQIGSDDTENPYIRFMANRMLDTSAERGPLERLSRE